MKNVIRISILRIVFFTEIQLHMTGVATNTYFASYETSWQAGYNLLPFTSSTRWFSTHQALIHFLDLYYTQISTATQQERGHNTLDTESSHMHTTHSHTALPNRFLDCGRKTTCTRINPLWAWLGHEEMSYPDYLKMWIQNHILMYFNMQFLLGPLNLQNKTCIPPHMSCSTRLTILDLKMSRRPERWLYWLGTLRRWTISKSVRTPGPWQNPEYILLHFCWICTNRGTWLDPQNKRAAGVTIGVHFVCSWILLIFLEIFLQCKSE